MNNVRNKIGVSVEQDSSGKVGKMEDDMDFGAIDEADEFD